MKTETVVESFTGSVESSFLKSRYLGVDRPNWGITFNIGMKIQENFKILLRGMYNGK